MPKQPAKSRRATWASKAKATRKTLALRTTGVDETQWAACGLAWDVAVIAPLELGLQALDRLGADTDAGHPVLGDDVSGRLYVMVPAGTGDALVDVSCVRVLSVGQQLLLPSTPHGSVAAHWISAPGSELPQLLPADKLATTLRGLTTAESESVAAS
ncbi:hypothetical protein [Streptomyces mirabilis]|uniref:hypothetical protein n=1 Tax=Streptomyces mirabilis TaxID=68239 RepID=UPI0036910C31